MTPSWAEAAPTSPAASGSAIAIARAMLKDAPIVVLDEATAYIDPENEALVQRAVGKLVAGRTVLVIAHRLSTITGADQIVVVNGGRIEATGKHEKLWKPAPSIVRCGRLTWV